MAKPVSRVTIVCITYNHASFIRDALESFVTQKTNFPFEVLAADDASTDGTADIIREYADRYPHIIKTVLRDANIGAIRNFVDSLSRVHTEYVIVNEGDDYFSCQDKLQKQVAFLDAHPECSICFHPVTVHFEDGSTPDTIFPHPAYRFNKTLLTIDDLVMRNFIQTNSALYRWRFTSESIAEVFPCDILPGDWYAHLLHAQRGAIGFIDDCMSVYRRHSGGLWWESTRNTDKQHLCHGISILEFYCQVHRNIAPDPHKYYSQILLPSFQTIIGIFFKYQHRAGIETLYAKHRDLLFDALFLLFAQLTGRIDHITQSFAYRLLHKISSIPLLLLCHRKVMKIGHILKADIDTVVHSPGQKRDEILARIHKTKSF